jgi:hypothetical protein
MNTVEPEDLGSAPRPAATVRTGSFYTIGLLFYLTTLAAILTVAAAQVVRNELATPQVIASAALGSGFVGLLAGMVFGLRLTSSTSGTLLGGGVGTCVGVFGGWLLLVQPQSYWDLLNSVSLGCAALIVFVLASDRWTHRVKS